MARPGTLSMGTLICTPAMLQGCGGLRSVQHAAAFRGFGNASFQGTYVLALQEPTSQAGERASRPSQEP